MSSSCLVPQLTYTMITDPTFPGGSKWCVCHFPGFVRILFTHPNCSRSDGNLQGTQFACMYFSIIRGFSNRIYPPVLPFSPPSVLFSITKPTTEVFSRTVCLHRNTIFPYVRCRPLNCTESNCIPGSVHRRENELQCRHKNDKRMIYT